MDIHRAIQWLREQLALTEDAIHTLERLEATRGRRRGRPPKWLRALRPAESVKAETKKERQHRRGAK